MTRTTLFLFFNGDNMITDLIRPWIYKLDMKNPRHRGFLKSLTITNEEWANIEGTHFFVSDEGGILKFDDYRRRKGVLKYRPDGKQYRKAIHTSAFIDELVLSYFSDVLPECGQIPKHLDGNPDNCALSNLEWMDTEETYKHRCAHLIKEERKEKKLTYRREYYRLNRKKINANNKRYKKENKWVKYYELMKESNDFADMEIGF